jgi:hypothetical protein
MFSWTFQIAGIAGTSALGNGVIAIWNLAENYFT